MEVWNIRMLFRLIFGLRVLGSSGWGTVSARDFIVGSMSCGLWGVIAFFLGILSLSFGCCFTIASLLLSVSAMCSIFCMCSLRTRVSTRMRLCCHIIGSVGSWEVVVLRASLTSLAVIASVWWVRWSGRHFRLWCDVYVRESADCGWLFLIFIVLFLWMMYIVVSKVQKCDILVF